MSKTHGDPQAAPGDLETVRELLNTWRIPNDVREPVDDFDAHAQGLRLSRRESNVLRQLRDDLRGVMEQRADIDATLDRWVERSGARLAIRNGAVRFRAEDSAAGQSLVLVLDAIASDVWPRLKACPDCRWVFYDHTRNGAKRWCLMNAGGSGGRGCGNIAKVRRYRPRQRTGELGGGE